MPADVPHAADAPRYSPAQLAEAIRRVDVRARVQGSYGRQQVNRHADDHFRHALVAAVLDCLGDAPRADVTLSVAKVRSLLVNLDLRGAVNEWYGVQPHMGDEADRWFADGMLIDVMRNLSRIELAAVRR